MCSSDIYTSFVDKKFIGIDKLNASCTNNVSLSIKLIRIFKEYYLAQDIYSKAALKCNVNLSQLAKEKLECFHPHLEALSTTFCVFANVQKEFSNSINGIIKTLTSAFETNESSVSRVFEPRDVNLITNFKNAQAQLEKSRMKYSSVGGSIIDSSNNDDRSDKTVKRVRETHYICVTKYNKMRVIFLDVMKEGFERSKQIQLAQLEAMQRCVKNVGNALAKLMFDMKESVDSLKHFYKSNNKDALFLSWVDSNKTVDDISIDSFPKAVSEDVEGSSNDDILVDISMSPSTNGMKRNVFQSRQRKSHLTNESSIIDQDIPDAANIDVNSNNRRNSEKTNTNALKDSKRRWTGINILKKFQSTNDLMIVSETKESIHDENWQSKSNLNERVITDDEGFIIRESKTDSTDMLSESSSTNSSTGNQLKGIKVNIRPINNSVINAASNFDVISAAMQLPIPKREKLKKHEGRRISNLQRSSRTVTDLDKDRYSRRSLSVSEMRPPENNLDSPCINKKPMPCEIVIPIASAMTEILSSKDGGYSCTIQGQLVLAWPLYIKDHLQASSISTLPDLIVFDLLSGSYKFSSAQIIMQYNDVARLEMVNDNEYNVVILKELLQRICTDRSLSNNGNRISFPLLEYSVDIDRRKEKIIDCRERWSQIDEFFVQFDFSVSSKAVEKYKCITVHVKLQSEGFIDDVASFGDKSPTVHNDRHWSLDLGRRDEAVSVKIKNSDPRTVTVKLSYEFIFENYSLVNPHLALKCDKELPCPFKISLIHYRTIATGNFSQVFVFDLA